MNMTKTTRGGIESGSRREMIALATIVLLGKHGSRGLSHRNIDKHLGLPEGSTSFYFRRRADLLEAGFRKLIDDNMKMMEKHFAPVMTCAAAGQPVELKLIAECQYRLWKSVAKPKNRNATLARFEFFLQGARCREVQSFQDKTIRELFDFGAAVFATTRTCRPRWASFHYFNLLRADTMTYFLVPSALPSFEVTPAYFLLQTKGILEAVETLPEDLPG